jgi:bifunctional non-homologous end joining protein LigD
VTPHAWLSRADRLDFPVEMIFDLDPPEAGDARVRPTALRLGALLHELGLPAFAKTSGSRGYHVVVPLDGAADYDLVRDFSQDVAALLARAHREHLTTEVRKRRRGGRILIDTLRNAYAHTAVPPYAVRARPGAPVAMPVDWAELEDPTMQPQRYTLRDVPTLLLTRADPWRALSRSAVSLAAARPRLDELLAEHRPQRVKIPRRTTPQDELQGVGHEAGSKPSVKSRGLSRQRQSTNSPPR